ncbi:MAG: hypothetical protein GYA34_00325 [Chloroflexi bacterium]|nr:hypothetical protein [Chloroflexota bacterium]
MMVLKCDKSIAIPDMCKQFGVLVVEAEKFLEPMAGNGLIARNEGLTITEKGEEMLAK